MIPVCCIHFPALVLITKWLSHYGAQSECAINITNRVPARLFFCHRFRAVLHSGEHRLRGICSQDLLHESAIISGVATAQHPRCRRECSSGSVRFEVAARTTPAPSARRWAFASSLSWPKLALWGTHAVPFATETGCAVNQPSFCPICSSRCPRREHLETDQCASGELTSIAISAGAVLSGYLIQRDGLPTLGLSLLPQDESAVDLREHWDDITRGLPDECRDALWEAMLASCDPDPYPTNAAYHLVQGMSHLGDVYDGSWDTLLYEVFTFVVREFCMERGDWPAACAIVHRVCAHLERRAEANGSELAERDSATMDPARHAALRESRKTFLEKVVGFKHGTWRVYQRPSNMAIQQGDDSEPSDGTRHQGKALASRGDDVLAYAATTDLLVQAADLVIEQLPPSREYASKPEEIDFLDWQRRASLFMGLSPPPPNR